MAFQSTAFQVDAFQIVAHTQTITDTDTLHLPVDYALAGKQLIKDRYREYDIRNGRPRERTRVAARGGVRRLEGGQPSFTITSTRKGYD